MKKKLFWFSALAVLMALLAACGPQMATPTPKQVQEGASPTAAAISTKTQATQAPATPTVAPVDAASLPVDPNDWHALGSPDAKVTFVEYSDFQ